MLTGQLDKMITRFTKMVEKNPKILAPMIRASLAHLQFESTSTNDKHVIRVMHDGEQINEFTLDRT